MDRNIEAEVRDECLNTWCLYGPLKPSESGYTSYLFNATDSIVQHLFESPASRSHDCEASTSAATSSSDNNPAMQSSMPPPPFAPRRKSTSSRFNKTVVKGKRRECQLCDREYGNKKHQSLYRERNICCVCRLQFDDEISLIEHVDQRAITKKCCLCGLELTDDPKANDYHFKRHHK